MSNAVDEAVVRKNLRVQAPIELAFSVFVEQMEAWWPPTHHIAKTPFEAIFVEPRVGGRWYEQDAEGNTCEWGKVLAWDPPHRVAFSWHIGPREDDYAWTYDPEMSRASEVEIRFTADGPGATLIQLEHSKLERHGAGAEKLRAIFDGPGAWIAILAAYAQAAEEGK